MASSKLLKEAIADATAVRETAIANAKIALEEAFTPRLQSILSKKIQAEIEEGEEAEEEDEMNEENDASSEIGKGDNKQPADKANDAYTDLSGISKQSGEPGSEVEDYKKVKDLTEGEDAEDEKMDEGEDMDGMDDMHHEGEEHDEDEMDLESIIRELEAELGEGEDMEDDEMTHEGEDMESDDMHHEGEEHAEPDADNAGGPSDHDADNANEGEDDEIDLDEILREMGYGDDEEEKVEEGEEEAKDDEKMAEMQSELEEAYSTIKSLKSTINEVNLLNAKLLYANKLFRSYNLTNEQKVKVVENLDRTSNVREVKLVYATLAESMKFGGTERKVSAKKSIAEGLASKAQASTAPKKEIIAESNELAKRFKQLAGII
jgi:hypothetical protein